MPVLTGEVLLSSRPRHPRRPGRPRRRLAAIAATGLAGAALVTGTVTAAVAAAPAPAPTNGVTLTSFSSSSAGHLILRLRYEVERVGKIKLLSISYAGGTGIKLRHPELIVSLRPVAPFPRGQVNAGRKGVPVISFFLRLRNTRHFSGTVPVRVFGRTVAPGTGRRFPAPVGGRLLEATVASVTGHGKQVAISLPVGLQVGLLLGPAIP